MLSFEGTPQPVEQRPGAGDLSLTFESLETTIEPHDRSRVLPRTRTRASRMEGKTSYR